MEERKSMRSQQAAVMLSIQQLAYVPKLEYLHLAAPAPVEISGKRERERERVQEADQQQ
jgi:hypothetical protein